MSTKIRPEVSKKNEYYVERNRYYELRHFCLQYPAWLAELNAFTMAYPLYPTDRIPSYIQSHAKPTEREVERREKFNGYVDLISICILGACMDEGTTLTLLYPQDPKELVDSDLMSRLLFLAVTRGLSYDTLKTKYDIPCSREYYYKLYRRFFWLLDTARK